ncbi:hypothetical protein V1264_006646 [Littorina saxatilis]|uniref:Uncharacterized protein n=1 Tax=Littorina saxatilis TaxID=31220 RepID=A0AAN9AXT9_9CAEN
MGIETVLGYEEIKGYLHVKAKERDTFVQTTDEQKSKNKDKLQFLRHVNDELRKEVAFHQSGGKHVVNKVFVSRPKEKPAMKGKDLRTSAQIMDQKAFEVSRSLGKQNYYLERSQEKLAHKIRQLSDIKYRLEYNPSVAKIEAYMKAQSKAELVKMKLMDAVNTANYYRKIIQSLQKISSSNQQVKAMTKCKAEKYNIVKEVNAIGDGCVKEFKIVQNQMRPLHIMIENKTREFDENLRNKKKEYKEQLRETNTKCMGELKMDIVEDDNPDARKAKELNTVIELKSFQDIFEEVKEALDISDVRDVLSRVQEEHLRYKRLCDQLDESNLLYDMLTAELEDLREMLGNLTYDPAPLGMSVAYEQELSREAEMQMARVQDAVRRLTGQEKTIAGIKLATVAIHSKLIYVKLHSTQPTLLVGEPGKDMEVIWNKTEKLLARYGDGNMEGEDHDPRELQKFFEQRLPEDNSRCVLRPLDYRSMDKIRYDFDDVQASYVSRDDIKKRQQEILKPKKRKPPAGRKGPTKGGKK